jgi:hypothetical protein
MQNITFPFTVTLAGDSIWDYEGPLTVTVTDISVYEDEDEDNGYKSISVEHDATWNIYTDSGFESAISEKLGYAVYFTEQGMQEDGIASMEA